MQLHEGSLRGTLVELGRVSLQDHLTSAQDNKGCISLDGGNDIHCAYKFLGLETRKHWELL
jgi:hypothetical protein